MSKAFQPTPTSRFRVFNACLLSFLLIMMPFVQMAAGANRSEVRNQNSKVSGESPVKSAEEDLFVNSPPLAGPITATKTDSYTSAPGPAAPGDTITYTVDVANTGATDAASVAFSDVIDANTTLVGGTTTASPVAVNDTYSAIQNTPLNMAAPGVMANDSGLPAPAATAIVAGPTTAGGTITLNADGSFTYTPPNASFTGPDTFTYTITNGNAPPNPGVDNVATVTINVDAAPTVQSTTPADNATDQATNVNIGVTFSEPVNVTGSWFTISCSVSGAHTAAVTGGPTTYTLNPNVDFTQGETCTVTVVAAQVTDVDTNDPPDNMVADYVFDFTMDAAPSVTSTTPTNGATNIATNSNITLNFSESVSLGATAVTISCATSGAHTSVTTASPNTSFTVNPNVDFAGGELCTVTVVAAQVSDTDANDPPNNMLADYIFSFTTDAAPTVTATTPTNGATNQATNTNITLTFSESVSLGATPVTISCTVSGAHTSVVSASPNTSFTVNPDVDFAANETCTVTVLAAQVTDTDSGDPPDNMAANYVFSFSTDAAPAVTTVTPTNGSTQVASNTNIVVNFSEPVNIVDATAFTVECPTGSPVAFSVTPAAPGASSSFTIDPTSDLPFNTLCTVTVVASKVTDTDANDPPDNMAANFVFSFTVDAVPTVTTTTPANSSLSNSKSTNVTINFSENVGVTAGGVTINCGAGNIAFSGLPQTNVASIVLDPTSDLPAGSTCTVTVVSANVTDSDAGDPPNNLDGDNNGTEGGDYVFTFGVAPEAVNDAYNATGNVGIVIAANGVLANDVGPGAVVDRVGTASANTVVPATVATSNGGSVTMNSDGSFTYVPLPGQASGTDTFKYRISNAGGVSADATVTITITGIIWFICDGCGGLNQGTLLNPYTSVNSFSTNNTGAANKPSAGQRIYIRSGTYDASNDNLTLLANQIVSGQGQAATSFFTPEAPAPAAYAALTAGTRPVIAPTTGNAVALNSGNSLTQLNLGSDVSGTCAAGSSPTNGTLLNAAAGVGALAISNMIINGCGRAINIPSGGTVGVVFDSVSSRNSTTGGVVWNSTTGGSVNFGPVTINNSTGVGVQMLSNASTFTFGNTSVPGSGGTGVELGGAGTGNSGTITFPDLDISPDSGQRGLNAQQNSGAITTTSGDIITTSGIAVSISGTSSANKTPLNVQLTKVSATNATTGISLTNTSSTGSPGGFRILGTGGSCTSAATCTGGAITGSGTTINGISMSGVSDVSFVRMFIQNTTDSGVKGTSVTNFSFTNGVIDNSGTALGAETSNIALNTQTVGNENNVSGVVTITNNTLTNPYYHGIDIFNFNGTISDATISTNTITSTNSTATSKGSGIRFIAFGSASTIANVTKATIANNIVSNFPSASGIQAQGGNGNAAGTAGVFGTVGSATNIIAITGNTVKGFSAANRIGTFGILANINGKGQGNFNISNNGTIANPLTNVAGTPISLGSFGFANMAATVDNNVIVANNALAAPGIGAGTSQTFNSADTPTLTVAITNNNISQTDGNGILTTARDATGDLNVSIKNNTVAAPLSGLRNGIRVDAGNGISVDDDVCADISGNITAGTGHTNAGIGLRKQGTSSTTNAFGIEGMGATASPGVEQYVGNGAGKNPGSENGTGGDGSVNGVILISAASGFSNCSSAPLRLAPGGVTRYDTGLSTINSDQLMTLSRATAFGSISDSLTQAELDLVVSAAIERWSDTGLTAQQMATLGSIRFDVTDLDGLYLGKANGIHIAIDRNAGGKGWYIGSDLRSDALFHNAIGKTRGYADSFGAPAGRVDLLTAIVHELGHRLGLDDIYAENDRDNLMYGYLTAGERRIPASGQAKYANLNSEGGSHFLSLAERDRKHDGLGNAKPRAAKAMAPVSTASAPASGETVNYTVGILPAGKKVRITFQVTVDVPFLGGTQVSNQGSITHSLAGSPVLTDDPDTGTADDPTITQVAGPPVANDDAYSTFKNTPLNVPAPGVSGNDTGSPLTITGITGCADVVAPFSCATTQGGTVVLESNGAFSYTPATNFTSAPDDTFEYSITGDTATVSITVADTSAIYINEVLFNPTGTNAPNEYIEIRGPISGLIPTGTYLVAIEGDAAENPGDVRTIINLSGLSFGSNGFLVLLQNGNTYTTDAGANVQTSTTTGFGGLPGGIWSADASATDLPDASVSFMLIQTGTTPALTDDIDGNDDGTADGSVYTGWSVRDSIGALDGGASDVGYGALTYALGGGGIVISPNTMAVVGFVAVYVGRVCNSTGSTTTDWVATGVLGGAAPNWTLGSNPEPPGFANKPLNHIGAANFANIGPTNSVPGAQSMGEDATLTFNAGNANLISIADPDVGGADMKVTLTATNGTFSLSGTTGLAFTVGDGTADPQMVFTGSLTNINNALNGLTFTPTSNFNGGATLSILTEDQGNSGCGGNLTDSDNINITVNPDLEITIHDGTIPEPSSGSANMVFTVSLSAPATGPVNVNFTTADEPPGPGKAVAGSDYTSTNGTVSFTAGQQVKTINVPVLSDADNAEVAETFLVQLSGNTGADIADGTATGTITVANTAGTVLISEIRTSGPGGLGDDFVEVYNNSNAPVTVAASDASAGWGLYKMGATCTDTPILVGIIPNGTVIPARGHYLFVGSQYSLTTYAAGNLMLSADIESDANVGIFTTSNLAAVSSLNRLDAVGFGVNVNDACDLLREGNTLQAVAGSNTEHSFFRKLCDFNNGCTTPGIPKDTNNNANDFMLADTAGTFFAPGQQHLGAPGPENIASPLRRDPSINVVLLDATASSATPPNRVRDFTADAPNASDSGTLSVRRRVVNGTGGNVTRLRFRIVELTTFPSPGGGRADLRARSSTNVVVSGINDTATCSPNPTPCMVTVKGTTLEQPPNQAASIGGGYNATLSEGTVTMGTPLAPGASTYVNFLLGVKTTGTFRVLIIVEALP